MSGALWLVAASWGASLDLLEIGGMWGSPVTQEPTAIVWNPGAMGAVRGTRFLVEGAPVFANVGFERSDPDWGGLQEYRYFGIAPYLGVSTDAGVDGLGLGLALSVPVARGATAVDPAGPGRMALREGDIRSIHATLAAGYEIKRLFGFGASVSYVYGSWYANLDTEYATSLADELVKANGGTQTDYYPDDAVIEDPRYQTTADFQSLASHDVTFSFGVQAKPHPWLDLALSYQHGWYAQHRGTAALSFDCPPDDDPTGRFGAEDRGLCFAEMQADAEVAYRYPGRLRFGAALHPNDDLRVELFGSYAFWSTFTDFEINLSNVTSSNTTITEETSQLVSKQRLWARDNRDSFNVGVDGKYRIADRFRVGVRVMFDRAAVPDEVLTPNNYDADTVVLGGLFGVAVVPQVEVALSFSEYLSMARESSGSAFDLAMDPDERKPDRYAYPGMAGRYTSSIHRLGISVRGLFDGSKKVDKRRTRDAIEALESLAPADPAPVDLMGPADPAPAEPTPTDPAPAAPAPTDPAAPTEEVEP
jgi:long-subunit fatty acid transport protein